MLWCERPLHQIVVAVAFFFDAAVRWCCGCGGGTVLAVVDCGVCFSISLRGSAACSPLQLLYTQRLVYPPHGLGVIVLVSRFREQTANERCIPVATMYTRSVPAETRLWSGPRALSTNRGRARSVRFFVVFSLSTLLGCFCADAVRHEVGLARKRIDNFVVEDCFCLVGVWKTSQTGGAG